MYDDWIAALSREKSLVFEGVVREWETAYAMMSVALDDALSLRTRGEIICARQQVTVAAELLRRLACALLTACDTLSSRGANLSDIPTVEPLKTEFFRGETAQSAASWNGLLHHVLFGDRSRFFHKLRILSGTVEALDKEFNEAAIAIFRESPIEPGRTWKLLDSLHYDLNTCLREAEVVLKSFLRALPAEQVSSFASEMHAPAKPGKSRVRARLADVSA